MSIRDELINDIFYDLDILLEENPEDHHAMTVGHEEVLGQFLDRTGIVPEELKGILVDGYLKLNEEK
jgi:hypothetical protein